jgi:hypothetical protein
MKSEYKFKKGDRVKVIEQASAASVGEIGIVTEESPVPWVRFPDRKTVIHESRLELAPKTGRVEKAAKVNFLLKYDLDEDPIEEFETMKQVNKRIKELLEVETLKCDSVVVYEIKSKKTVEFETGFKLKAA